MYTRHRRMVLFKYWIMIHVLQLSSVICQYFSFLCCYLPHHVIYFGRKEKCCVWWSCKIIDHPGMSRFMCTIYSHALPFFLLRIDGPPDELRNTTLNSTSVFFFTTDERPIKGATQSTMTLFILPVLHPIATQFFTFWQNANYYTVCAWFIATSMTGYVFS